MDELHDWEDFDPWESLNVPDPEPVPEPPADPIIALLAQLSPESLDVLRSYLGVSEKPEPAPPVRQDKTQEQIIAESRARAQRKCPHRTQAKRGRDIICAMCGLVIIANTQSGVDILDTRGKTEGQWTVDVHRKMTGAGAEVITDYEGEVG